MTDTDHDQQDWFKLLSSGAGGELAVLRVWVAPADVSSYQLGQVVLRDDGDWMVEYVGGAIDRGASTPEHPVYLRAVSKPVEVPSASKFT